MPIRIQLTEISRTDVKRIEQLRVTSTSGKSIPLTAVADVTFSQGPSTITRFDRQRSAKIGSDLVRGMALSEGREQFLKVVEDAKLPPSVKIAGVGRRRNSRRSGARVHHSDGHRPAAGARRADPAVLRA